MQNQALARALYSCQSVLVLDDVFASLDNAAARRIYGRLFCDEGLITRCGTTVIMATSLGKFGFIFSNDFISDTYRS